MLGKRLPRLDVRTLKLSKYISTLPKPPRGKAYAAKVPSWPIYLNDKLGDCVIAAAGHMIEQWTAYSGTEVSPTDNQILAGYEQIGGYIPGDPTTDNGCVMLEALNTWRTSGIAGHAIQAFAALGSRYFDRQVRQSVNLFGNCYIGLALPTSAQNQLAWVIDKTIPGNAVAGTWGGHCVPIVGYTDTWLTVVTWGQLLRMSWGFLNTYCDEAYAIVTPDFIQQNKLSPSGFNIAQLQADLAQL
jgi:hypothetical protein